MQFLYVFCNTNGYFINRRAIAVLRNGSSPINHIFVTIACKLHGIIIDKWTQTPPKTLLSQAYWGVGPGQIACIFPGILGYRAIGLEQIYWYLHANSTSWESGSLLRIPSSEQIYWYLQANSNSWGYGSLLRIPSPEQMYWYLQANSGSWGSGSLLRITSSEQIY